jgi:hypothetical protein
MYYAVGHHLPYFRRAWIVTRSQLGGVIHFSRDTPAPVVPGKP